MELKGAIAIINKAYEEEGLARQLHEYQNNAMSTILWYAEKAEENAEKAEKWGALVYLLEDENEYDCRVGWCVENIDRLLSAYRKAKDESNVNNLPEWDSVRNERA